MFAVEYELLSAAPPESPFLFRYCGQGGVKPRPRTTPAAPNAFRLPGNSFPFFCLFASLLYLFR